MASSEFATLRASLRCLALALALSALLNFTQTSPAGAW